MAAIEQEQAEQTVTRQALPLDRRSFKYTSCYCEENVYMLCKTLIHRALAESDGIDLFVVFISNYYRQIPIWCQLSSSELDGLCFWDYHVICVQKATDGNAYVWDLDSTLPCPTMLDHYANEALRPGLVKSPHFKRLFRVVAASQFLKFFASDRSHMKDATGKWKALPPKYDCIMADDGAINNLDQFISMPQNVPMLKLTLDDLIGKKFGIVVLESDFINFFEATRISKQSTS